MKRRHIGSDQNGQAIIEYILILVVVIALVLGLAYQFNAAFRTYVASYFGNYIACLLETGEMPALGSNEGGGICDAQFQPSFNMASAPSSPGGSRGVGRGGGTSGRAGEQTSESRSGGGNPSARASSRDGGGGPGGADFSGAGSAPKSAASYFNRRGRPQQTSIGQLASGSEDPKGLEAIKGRGRAIGNLSGDDGRAKRMTLDRRFFAERDLEQSQVEKPIVGRISEEDGSGSKLRPKVTTIEAKRGVAAVSEEKEESFGIGRILRLLIIIAIVVTLVLLIGGQALQISKSWEK